MHGTVGLVLVVASTVDSLTCRCATSLEAPRAAKLECLDRSSKHSLEPGAGLGAAAPRRRPHVHPSARANEVVTSKERLHQMLLDLSEDEAEIVWEIYSSRPRQEDVGDAIGRGLVEVFRRRRTPQGATNA